MNYQSLNSGGEESWNENVKKGLKVEITLKIWMIFLLIVNLYVVQKSKKVKCYLKIN